jgi:hypothetical protein
MVEAPNTTDPAIQQKIKDNERCWKNSAQVWAEVRNLLEKNSRLNIT